MRRIRIVLLGLCALVVSSCEDMLGPEDRHYVDVATGGYHTCAIAESGEAYCWGRGTDGELGTGGTANEMFPAAVKTAMRFTQISAGAAHTCAIGTDERVYCWGWSVYYQMGDTSTYSHLEPERVPIDSPFVQIAAGDHHNCGITRSSAVYCWGYNRWGQAGNATTQVTIYPIPVTGGFKASAISAGGAHTCAIALGGGAYCWGSNEFGQLGIGSDRPLVMEPTPVVRSSQFVSIEAGFNHTCAIDRVGKPFCWGYNEFGQLGDATPWVAGVAGPASPGPVVLLDGVREISAGVNHTCATDQSGRTWCWGRGMFGQNGIGSTRDQSVRQPVSYQPTSQYITDYLEFDKLATGGATHTCGLGEGTIFCWGTGRFGQLGLRTTYFTTPQPIDQQ